MILDIVIPCFNDQVSLVELLKRLDLQFPDSANIKLIYVVVDNCSNTCVFDYLGENYNGRNTVIVHRLVSNVGYQNAIQYGLKQSFNDYCLVIDSDLEDPPAVARQMVDKIVNENLDVVAGERVQRAGITRFYKFWYGLFYRMLRWTSENVIFLNAGEFAVYSKAIVDRLRTFPDGDSFVRVTRSMVSSKLSTIPYRRDVRFAGRTRFKFWGSFDLAIQGLLSNAKKPLRLFTYIGLAIFAISGFMLGLNIMAKVGNLFFGLNLPLTLPTGMTQTAVILYGLLLVLFIQVTIIGEYLIKILDASNNRPIVFAEGVKRLNVKD